MGFPDGGVCSRLCVGLATGALELDTLGPWSLCARWAHTAGICCVVAAT